MTSCNRSAKLISRYIDNDLEPAVHRSVEAHMASCADCKKVFNSYSVLKQLVIESHTEMVSTIQESALMRAPDKKQLSFPVWNTGFKLAAMLILTCSVAAAFFIHTSSKQTASLPSVIERDGRVVMNTPLGALVYYEEITGQSVQAQFGGIKETSPSLYQESNISWRTISSYESPLFCDNSLVDQKYKSITTMSVF
jgi:hypothetical protein